MASDWGAVVLLSIKLSYALLAIQGGDSGGSSGDNLNGGKNKHAYAANDGDHPITMNLI